MKLYRELLVSVVVGNTLAFAYPHFYYLKYVEHVDAAYTALKAKIDRNPDLFDRLADED